MRNNDVLRRAIRYALFANVAAGAGISVAAAAGAAGPETPTENTAVLSEVIVTGSRVSAPGLESISPVTTVNSDEIKQQGVTRIEDLLNTLPQVFGDQGSGISNGGTGEATVDLRGLGTQRTLVLINGRRLMPGDPTIGAASAPDLNNIPASLVDRVDVLTGGASSVYGADAVAGVVNFIMNDHFEGVRLDANVSINNHNNHDDYIQGLLRAAGDHVPTGSVNDGSTKDLTFVIGSNLGDGKGNVTAYVGYRKVDALLEATRDFSGCSTDPASTGGFHCNGSGTSAFGKFTPFIGGGNFAVDPVTGFGPYAPASKYNFNYAPTNFFQRPDDRWTGGEFFHYDITDKMQVYNEFMFMHDKSVSQIAPGGAFYGSGTAVDPVTGIPNGGVNINCDNPLLTPAELTAICGGATTGNAQLYLGRRNVEGGGRINDLEHTSFRAVIGTKGEIFDGLKYDTYAMEGQTLYQNAGSGNFSKNAIANSLQVVAGPNGPVCISGPPCVPYNIFVPGGVTPAQLAYLQIPVLTNGSTEERVWDGNVTADLGKYGIKSPLASNGIIVNVGAQWRSEHVVLHTDEPQINNDVAGNGSPTFPLEAGFSVWEGYAEARVPILMDQPLAKELSFETGYRYSAYSLGFDTNTFKFGLDWAPSSDVRFRGSFQRAVRAPNLQELFQQKFVGLDGGPDPCATSSGSPAPATIAQCMRTGLTAAQYGAAGVPGNPAGQYNGQIGGNPALKPESSDTTSFGIVLTPSFIPNLNVTFDYFNIHIKNVISSYGFSYEMNQCIANATPLFCNNIHRDAAGSLWLSTVGFIDDGTLNLGALQTRGVDMSANYKVDMSAAGKLHFYLNGTYLAQLQTTPDPATGGTYDCAGYFGNTCGVPAPKVKTKFRMVYETPLPGLDLSAQWRHLSAVLDDLRSPNPLLAGAVTPQYARLPSFNYLDLTASYTVNKTIGLRVGVNNVLDKDPPQLSSDFFPSSFVNGNTFVQVYDSLGRFVFANVTLNF